MNTLRDQLQHTLSGSYLIEREIGRGGMATVYLARDEKHHRNVALKVLDPELGAVLGGERFLSEIRVTAGLQHPNLLPLFDSGAANGLLYYVMPFVEGESLRHLLQREKQLPVDEAVRIATAIANALDYAHNHGVVHRDLKPENILMQAGQPVVADFGIALAVSNAGGARITQTGLSLGTPQYMSPEQATGDRVIDGRTDIYSLGAILYEMLAGEPPHTGSSAQAIIAKLMTTEPQSVRVLRPSVPPNVAMAVEHALAKLPADRIATAKKFADALHSNSYANTTAAPASIVPTTTSKRVRVLTALGMMSPLLLLAALWGWLRPEAPAPRAWYALALDSTEALIPTYRYGRVALSPDGQTMAYIGGPENAVMVRRRDELHARRLEGSAQSGTLSFSPDGRRIAYIQTGRTLMVASLDGAPPFEVTDSLVGLGGTGWLDNNTLIVDGRGSAPLVRVAANAHARPEFLVNLDTAALELDQLYPVALPDHKSILFTSGRQVGSKSSDAIALLDLDTKTSKVLIADAMRAQYSPSGHLIYSTTTGNLMAVPFDLTHTRVTGEPVLIAQGLSTQLSGVDFSVSSNGLLVYVGGGDARDERELVWVRRDGTAQAIDSTWRLTFVDPALSPDGRALAISTGAPFSSQGDIWIRRLDNKALTKLSVEGSTDRMPGWTQDGRSVIYLAIRGTNYSIMEKPADGSALAKPIFTARVPILELSVSPRNNSVLYKVFSGAGRTFIRRIGDTVSTEILQHEPLARFATLSPDGKYVAYQLAGSGDNPHIFVSPFPNTASAKWDVSVTGGSEPVWSDKGDEIIYRKAISQQLWSVRVSTSPSFTYSEPTMLVSTARYTGRLAVSPDASRFLMVRRIGDIATEKLTFMENWTRMLDQRKER